VYPLHPLTVHFPIALLLAGGLLSWLYLRSGHEAYETSAFHCLSLGWLGASLALLTGALDALRQLPLDDALLWLNLHALSGLALTLLFGQALLERRRDPTILKQASPRRRAYLTRIALGCLLVVVSGWLGGYLVYGLGLGIE
jgi:uncharacterized membrane protein